MKKKIVASDYRSYTVTISFGGYVGSENDYEVDGDFNEDGARKEALEQAKEDLSVEDITETDDEYEVEVGFAGMMGVSNTYTVYADDEEEAEAAAPP